MPLINLRTLLDHASEHNYAVPSFNISNVETMNAILLAAQEVDSPVVLQVSSGGRKFLGSKIVKSLLRGALEAYPKLPIVLHQDHGHTEQECFMSIRDGYSSVMMDGSLDKNGNINSLNDNILVTKKVVDIASSVGVSVEGEIGCLGKIDGLDSSDYLTSVDDAVRFVSETNVDALAIAIGTSHGAYKFSNQPNNDVLSISRLKELNLALPNVHFVLHGSSSISQEHLSRLRQLGAEIKETYGVPIESMVEAISFGVRKFNIDTDLRIATMLIIREFLVREKYCLDPRKMNQEIINFLKKIVMDRYITLRSGGMASKLMSVI